MRVLRLYLNPLMALSVMAAVATAASAQERSWHRPDSEGAAEMNKSASFVSDFDVSDQAVTFRTKGRYAGFVLRVSGPEDFHVEQRIAGDAVPRFLIRGQDGILSDGHYSIELTATPLIPAEYAASLEQARASGDRRALRKAMKRAGLEPESMIYSTGVRVMQGRFLDPTVTEAVEGRDEKQIDNGDAPTDAVTPPARLAAVSDATYQPGSPRPEFVDGPAVKSPALNRALAAVQQEALPEFIAAQSLPNAPWSKASFQNQNDDGAAIKLDGYLRPVVAENYSEDPLVQAYFRQANADGQGFGPWLEAYFEPMADGGFRLVKRATVEQSASLFDYVAAEDQPVSPMPDQQILDDLIVDGSLCVGLDCVNGESFGFETIRIKENNLRIRAFDTSSSASFPSNDWQITFNDSSNGGANKFSIDDLDGGRVPMTIEAGAPSHSLFVEDGGRIGFGTSAPVVELHVVDGDSPTLRLQQDGSSGFTQQTWDVAGNEANFFVRDATNGSRLPFKIIPGAATNSIVIDTDGEVGLQAGTNPAAALHVKRANNTAQVLVEETGTGAAQQMLVLSKAAAASGGPIMRYTGPTKSWDVTGANLFSVNDPADGVVELTLNSAGNLTIEGDFFSATCLSPGSPCAPDYVFESDYDLMSLSDLEAFITREKHLPNVPSESDLREAGVINHSEMQMTLLEKIEELVLYTIQQEKTIKDLEARLAAVEVKSNK